ANHNNFPVVQNVLEVVVNISKSKNESKSQLDRHCWRCLLVVVNISKSKNESKSQQNQRMGIPTSCCGKYQ
ncbi:MAG: hypothetical protein ACYCZO_02745, partial [Daejeonella sp.]